MKNEELKEVVQGSWVHSHEEDTETEKVFRPADYNFPPARGRTGFHLEPSGSLVEIGPAPDDRIQSQKGTWEVTQDGDLIIRPESPKRTSQLLKIVSAEKDKLVVKK